MPVLRWSGARAELSPSYRGVWLIRPLGMRHEGKRSRKEADPAIAGTVFGRRMVEPYQRSRFQLLMGSVGCRRAADTGDDGMPPIRQGFLSP